MSARFWWVNHSHTCHYEIEGAYLWFAQSSSKSKARSENEKNAQRLLPGDVILSVSDGSIGAAGVVLGSARRAAKPRELESVAENVDFHVGWLVPVRFMAFEKPLITERHIAELIPVLPRKHSPVLPSGASNQYVRLAAIPPPMTVTLRRLLGGEVDRIVETITEAVGRTLAEDTCEAEIQHRSDIGPAQKAELLRARQGQGTFRRNVEVNEHSCRITGVLDRRHLRATHIKPWCECDDAEMVDGFNGLLMSPHMAHLFERGYISFADDGELLVSQELNPVVLEKWRIELPLAVGPFRPQQSLFLDYHRREVFQQHGGGRRQRSQEPVEDELVEPDAAPAVVHPA
jgi:putative restriction endonuclease